MRNTEINAIANNIEKVAKAIVRGEQKITINNQEFNIPGGQTSGTETQKLMYARIKAREVLKG